MDGWTGLEAADDQSPRPARGRGEYQRGRPGPGRLEPAAQDGRVAGVRPRDAVGDNPGLRWASRAELQAIGLPAPVRRLLEDG